MQALATSKCQIDGYGHFWVSTVDGIVRYNGSNFDFFNTTTHPEMPTDEAGSIYKDSRNRMWFSLPKGLVQFDETRRLKRMYVVPQEPDRRVNVCFENHDGTMTAISQGKAFNLDPVTSVWHHTPWIDSLVTGSIRDVKHVSKGLVIFIIPSRGIVIIDTQHKRLREFIPVLNVQSAVAWDDSTLYYACSGPLGLYKVNLYHPDSLLALKQPDFVIPGDDGSEIQYIDVATDGKLYMTTYRSGLIVYDPVADAYHHFDHDPVDPNSIMDTRLRYINADDRGNILIAGISGLNYTNVNGSSVRYFGSIQTDAGNIMDKRVTSLAEDGNGRLWFTSDDQLYAMRLSDRRALEIELPATSAVYNKAPFLTYVAYAKADHMWASYHGDGVAVFDTTGRHVRDLNEALYPDFNVALNEVRIMRKGPDGWMYIGSSDGLFRMDPDTYLIDTFQHEPAMKPLRTARIVDILFLPDVLWIATSPGGGAWKYQISTGQLTKYTTENGLSSNRVYALGVDTNGIILAGLHNGLSMIFNDGHIQSLRKGFGIPGSRIEAIQQARDGSIWVANSYNLLHYDPATRMLKAIVGEPHLSEVGFQVGSSTALSSGQLAFGGHKGFIIVDPNVRNQSKADFEVFIFYKDPKGDEILCSSDNPLRLNSNERLLHFEISISNLILATKMVYRYKLNDGRNDEWSEATSLTQFQFNLQPGRYILEAQAYNGATWISAQGPVHIHIPYPWWQRWWVIALSVIALISGIGYIIASRIRKFKAELSLAHQINELESKALRAQMNPHFVFNCLNAIQECIVTGKVDEAYTYLSKFSKLLRTVLEHSDMTEVPLHDELEVLSLYISLEKLRFMDDLEFELNIDPELDSEMIFIPPMLIQPHLENAIWHGLRHRSGHKTLRMSITEKTPGYLLVMVEDNGIGRVKAAEIRRSRLGQEKHKSKGRQLSHNRLDLLKGAYPHTSMEIVDLYHESGEPAGTRIILVIPMLKSKTVMNPAKS